MGHLLVRPRPHRTTDKYRGAQVLFGQNPATLVFFAEKFQAAEKQKKKLVDETFLRPYPRAAQAGLPAGLGDILPTFERR